MRDGVVRYLPEKPTKSVALQTLWRARSLTEDARKIAGSGSVSGVVFTGHRTKQLIKQAERQLGVRG